MSAETADAGGDPFSARAAAIILAVGIMSFAAITTLVAWAPEIARRDQSGQHAFSESASGYGGLVAFLRAADRPVSVSRLEQRLTEGDSGLLILAPPGVRGGLDLDTLAEPALIILPKWLSPRDPENDRWEYDTRLRPPSAAEDIAAIADDDAEVWRIRTPARIETKFGTFSPSLGDDLQVLRSEVLEPVVETVAGAIVARVPDRRIYLLAEPDLLNTAGLADIETARMALALIDNLSFDSEAPITFDATLNGFTRSASLLRMVLDAPFLGATLIALAAAGLLGWAATIRFGAPEQDERAFALGKEALADNTAALVSMARRESRMAPAYLTLSERAAARALGAPRTAAPADIAAMIDQVSSRPGDDAAAKWVDVAIPLQHPALSAEDLVKKARALHERRMEITHGRK